MIPIILTLMCVELVFKNQFETRKTLNIIRWIIIIYSLVTFTVYIAGMWMNREEYAFVNRATGPYAWAYWIMLLATLLFPLSLFFKKLASRFWYVLIVAFGIKIGLFFERFVIITTSLHRDYLPGSDNSDFTGLPTFGVEIFFLQGLILAILSLGIFELVKRKKLCRTDNNRQ